MAIPLSASLEEPTIVKNCLDLLDLADETDVPSARLPIFILFDNLGPNFA